MVNTSFSYFVTNWLNSRCVMQSIHPLSDPKWKNKPFWNENNAEIFTVKWHWKQACFTVFSYHICETTDRGCATFQKSLSVSFLTLIKRWGERRYFKKFIFLKIWFHRIIITIMIHFLKEKGKKSCITWLTLDWFCSTL